MQKIRREKVKEMKALRCGIYERKNFSNCSNHGISEKYDSILLLNPEGNIEVNGDEENLCKVVKRNLFGDREYYHIEPVAKPSGVGWMSGGSIVYTSDSRFPFDYPLCLHDRTETQEEYDTLSH